MIVRVGNPDQEQNNKDITPSSSLSLSKPVIRGSLNFIFSFGEHFICVVLFSPTAEIAGVSSEAAIVVDSDS